MGPETRARGYSGEDNWGIGGVSMIIEGDRGLEVRVRE